MTETEGVQEQVSLGQSLARQLPPLDSQAAAAALPVAGAATRAMKWLGDEIEKLLQQAKTGDCDAFLTVFEDVRRRARALEPVVQQLRPRWAASSSSAADVDDGDEAVGHLAHYLWCRQVILTVWAAACPKKLRAAIAASHGALVDFDVAPLKAHWPTVRAALDGLPETSASTFHTAMDAELRTMTNAPTVAPVAKAKPGEIPKEHLSRPIGKAEAAKLHSGSNVPDPAAYFRDLVERNLMKPPIVNGRSLQFDVRDFPASKRESMR
jgi:hypothetical protein